MEACREHGVLGDALAVALFVAFEGSKSYRVYEEWIEASASGSRHSLVRGSTMTVGGGGASSSPYCSWPTSVHPVLAIAMRKNAHSSGLRFRSQHMAAGIWDPKSREHSDSSFNNLSA